MSKSVIIIGAGVVGLACGKELSNKGYEVFIAEQEQYIATQTSARNSGVIHAGIYYPTDSLKAKLCVRGKKLLFEYCEKFNMPFNANTEKDAIRWSLQRGNRTGRSAWQFIINFAAEQNKKIDF